MTLAVAAASMALLAITRPAAAQSSTVRIVDFGFTPATVQVTMVAAEPTFPEPHAHVGFVNNGAVPHRVVFDDDRVRASPTLHPSDFFDAVITVAGTFSYHCSIHPGMQGTVTVAPLPTTTTTTIPSQPSTTEPPATQPPTTAASASSAAPAVTARPRPTTTTTGQAAGATTTAAPVGTAATIEATTVPGTGASSTAVTDRRLEAAAERPGSDSPRWSVLVLVLLLLGGGGLFAGRTLWWRRRLRR